MNLRKFLQLTRLVPTTTAYQTKTVRYMFSVLISLVAIMLASALTSVDVSYIELVPSKSVVMSGEVFSMDVTAYAHVPVNALEVSIGFQPEAVEVIGVDIGQSVLTVWTQEPVVRGNSIDLSGGTYRRGFIGEHTVATIKLKAVKSGKTEFMVKTAELLAGDGKGTPVTVDTKGEKTKGSFVIYDQDEDPSKLTATLDVGITTDIDGDGKVTLRDISSFMSAWYDGSSAYDFNNDNKMNFVDFSIILARSFFGSSN